MIKRFVMLSCRPIRQRFLTWFLSVGLPALCLPVRAAPLQRNGDIMQVLACGAFPAESLGCGAQENVLHPFSGEDMRLKAQFDGRPWEKLLAKKGVFDFKPLKNEKSSDAAATYLSFWVSNPRDLGELLSESNIPIGGLDLSADDALQVLVNGQEVLNNDPTGPLKFGNAKDESIKLHCGWNHFLIKVSQNDRKRQLSGSLTCNRSEFLTELVSAFEKPPHEQASAPWCPTDSYPYFLSL